MMAVAEKKSRRSDLPDRVLEFLAEHGPATPYVIGKGIGRSAGAVAVAGKYLSGEGRLTLSEKPVVLHLTDAKRPAARRAATPAKSASKKASRGGKAADRIATLNAHKAAASAARDAGHPIPDARLAKMDVAQAGKVERARRTRQAPPAVATAS